MYQAYYVSKYSPQVVIAFESQSEKNWEKCVAIAKFLNQ